MESIKTLVHLVHYTPAAQEINQTTMPRRLEIHQLRILEMDQREITQIQQQIFSQSQTN